jgi:glutamine amidotransferase
MTIALIDYGAGNLASVIKALHAVGADVRVATNVTDLDETRAIIVPGVGHFGATRSLDEAWHQAIRRRLDAGVPLLGICLGLQWLFEGSAEAPDVRGLGLLPGVCSLLPSHHGTIKVPHVGWNVLERTTPSSRILHDVGVDEYTYFTHSFAAPIVDATVAQTTHGVPFSSVVEQDHVFGAQFHPEKSGRAGLRLLANFVRIAESAH